MNRAPHDFIPILDNHLNSLIQLCNKLGPKMSLEPLFDAHLFKPKTPSLSVRQTLIQYLNEVKDNIHYLQQEGKTIKTDVMVYLTDKIINQLSALSREIATQSLRSSFTPKNEETRAETHCRYLSYEKRLLDMKRHFEADLVDTLIAQERIRLTQKLAAIEGRLFRCRRAIRRIEDDL